jgi:citrate lyase subunit beta/citryl-CoA lyase
MKWFGDKNNFWTMIAKTGNRGDFVRSDCYVELEIKESGGIKIDLKSKVKTLYGNSIISISQQILEYFEIKHAHLEIIDQGALDFTLAARIEAAVNLCLKTEKEYLIPFGKHNFPKSKVDKLRRSRLYLPGNNPKLMINSGIYKADGIILDLEDSVAPDRKHEARYIVRNALRAINFYGAERMVRINQIPEGLNDLEFIVPHRVNLILIPKCETEAQVVDVDKRIKSILGKEDHQIFLMPIIESSLGIINAYKIAKAAKAVVALAIGLEDYTADIGAKRTNEGTESVYARSAIINAARAAEIQPIDSVFSDIADMDALALTCKHSKAIGFVGMGCIHPRQVQVINKSFEPDRDEISKAQKIVLAFEDAQKNGSGVVALGSKMIDPPVVKRALQTISQAEKINTIRKNWRENDEK